MRCDANSRCAIIVNELTSMEARPLTGEKEAMRDQVRAAISSQTRPTVTILSCLLVAQDTCGYVSDEAIEEVATFLGATTNEVWGVASFYTNFRFRPPGQHMIEICWGPTCHVVGAARILKAVQDDLGLHGEGETEDNRASLKYNTCLGACSQAPVIAVDHQLMGRVTPETARVSVANLINGTT